MKKTYIIPALTLTLINCETLIAESFGVNDTTVEGNKGGWTKEDNSDWNNIWDE